MIRTVERGQNAKGEPIELCSYGRAGWAVFVYKPDKESEWKSVINGKFDDVISRYLQLTNRA